jgi:hypothetical protein
MPPVIIFSPSRARLAPARLADRRRCFRPHNLVGRAVGVEPASAAGGPWVAAAGRPPWSVDRRGRREDTSGGGHLVTYRAFTVEEANELLPRLRDALRQIRNAREEARRHYEKLQVLDALWGEEVTRPDNPDHDEYVRHRETISAATDIPKATIQEDLQGLADVGALRVTSEQEPKEYDAEWLVLEVAPFGAGTDPEILQASIFPAVAYGYEDESVERFLEKHSYSDLADLLREYRAVIGGEVDFDLETLAGDIPTSDIDLIRPALDYAWQRLSENPGFGYEYPD